MRGCSKMLVAAASTSATVDDNLVVGCGEVVDELVGFFVVEQGADGDFEDGGLAGGAGHVGAETVAAALGLPLGVEAEVDEGVVGERGAHEDVAAVPAVSAGRAAAGDELFAPERHGAVAAVAGFDSDSGFVDEHAEWGGRSSGQDAGAARARGGSRGWVSLDECSGGWRGDGRG